MKNTRSFALGFALALGLTLSGLAFAQTTAQPDQGKKHESCCCQSGSCSMKHDDKQHAQKEESKEHSHKDGCCCCSGDSCEMKMKEKQKQG